MLKKIFAVLLWVNLSFSATLMELLDSVQNLVTEYEVTGKALNEPYTYTKMVSYYEFGKLYTAYAMEKPAIEMLSIAGCSALPIDCKYYKYFLTQLSLESYNLSKRSIPIILGKVEAAYDAYADWWIHKHYSTDSIYREYRNLENLLKEKFLNAWEAFLKAGPQPIKFLISAYPKPKDYFLLSMISAAYYLGWIKNIIFYGDKTIYHQLILEKAIPTTVKFVPYKDPKYNYIHVYAIPH